MTFVELMNTAPAQKKGLMLAAIVSDGFSVSTAEAYAAGSRNPKLPEQINIQKHVRRIFGQSTPLEHLFPAQA